MDKKAEVRKIINNHTRGLATIEQSVEYIMQVFGWKKVYEETPPTNIELLAKSPDGTIYLTSWRESYSIFSCQSKSEKASQWYWKLAD